jgi:hypothetical protein
VGEKDSRRNVCFSRPNAISGGLDRDNQRSSSAAILTGVLRLRAVSEHSSRSPGDDRSLSNDLSLNAI